MTTPVVELMTKLQGLARLSSGLDGYQQAVVERAANMLLTLDTHVSVASKEIERLRVDLHNAVVIQEAMAEERDRLRKERDESIAIGQAFANEAQEARKQVGEWMLRYHDACEVQDGIDDRIEQLQKERDEAQALAAYWQVGAENGEHYKAEVERLREALEGVLSPTLDLAVGWRAVEAARAALRASSVPQEEKS